MTALEELEAEIAPMRLPPHVRRFWERVDPATLAAVTFPRFHGPDVALSSWRFARDEVPGLRPVALVQIAYTSQGGAIFDRCPVDGGFQRRFNGIGEWLEYIVRTIDVGLARRETSRSGPSTGGGRQD